MSQTDVVMCHASIRPHLWQELYNSIAETNRCSFKIFFCGPKKPDFKLPDNLIYIHSSEIGMAPCVEIAKWHAINEKSKYLILGPTDDIIMSPGAIDKLIIELENEKEESLVGFSFRPTVKSSKILNEDVSRDAPLGIMFPIMKRETAIKMGSLDKRFIGIYWERDLYLRLHTMGINFKTSKNVEVSEDMSRQKIPPNSRVNNSKMKRASREWHDHDIKVINSLWRHNSKINPSNPYFPAKRLIKPEFFNIDHLSFTVYKN